MIWGYSHSSCATGSIFYIEIKGTKLERMSMYLNVRDDIGSKILRAVTGNSDNILNFEWVEEDFAIFIYVKYYKDVK